MHPRQTPTPPTEALSALSPIDGRYRDKTAPLRDLFSEQALIRYRVLVEVRWLQALAACPDIAEIQPFGDDATARLERIIRDFSAADAARVKALESATKHDVKAVEYFLREAVAEHQELAAATEFIHFACTSEDINNLAQGLMLAESRAAVVAPRLRAVLRALADLAAPVVALPMLSRTHGQPASPTTLGREVAVFIHRLRRQLRQLASVPMLGKINGAVGVYNAHFAAYPDIDWPRLAADFVASLGLDWNPHTTQVESRDYMAEYFHNLTRVNTILLDCCRDLWGYIALGYFRQRPAPRETGSSTMPHKVNPIDFENAEGNLGLANSLLGHLADKLPVSRWQRDLSDSTVSRNLGVALAHCLIAWRSMQEGIVKLQADDAALKRDLDAHPETLAEAAQTVMRRHGIAEPYEKLKRLTRGRPVTAAALRDFIAPLDLPPDAKTALTALTPSTYTGNAEQQARAILAAMEKELSAQG